MKRRILVRITTAGETSVEADGFRGNGCEAATRAIEEALGSTHRRTRKPDFWRKEVHVQSQQSLGEQSSS